MFMEISFRISRPPIKTAPHKLTFGIGSSYFDNLGLVQRDLDIGSIISNILGLHALRFETIIFGAQMSSSDHILTVGVIIWIKYLG